MFGRSINRVLLVLGATFVAMPAVAQVQPEVVSTFSPASTNPQWDAPTGIAFDGSNLIVANGAGTGEFLEFTPSGSFVRSFDPPGIAPGDITWDGASVWLPDSFDQAIYQVDKNGNVLRSFMPPNSAGARLGLAWDGEYLWAADGDGGNIQVFDVASGVWPPPVVRTIAAPAPLTGALAWDGQHMWAGTLFGELYQLARDGSVVAGPFTIEGVIRIYGLAYDGRFLYATDPVTDLVHQISLNAGDADQDGVADGQDVCTATAPGQSVDAQGCSVADRCPCDGNKGSYVSCVARVSKQYVCDGILTKSQRQAAVVAASRSSCGR